MRILRGVALIASGALSLILVVVFGPLVRAMRRDRHARNERDADDRWAMPALPYNDDDPGIDVDDVLNEDDIDEQHDVWHELHGTRCDDRPCCVEYARKFQLCTQCFVVPVCYQGALFCGAACSAAREMHLPRGSL